MITAAIFDVDGTLVDSVDLHARAWQDAFADFGYQHDLAAIREQIGKGGDQLLPVFLTPEQMAAEGTALEEHRGKLFKARYLQQVQAFPKVPALFERLRAAGIRAALATSAKVDELEVYERIAGVEALVDERATSEDAERSKPHPDIFAAAMQRLGDPAAGTVLAIGDSPYDAQAAGKLGIRTIGLLGGGFAEASLREAGCVAIYRDPADLLARFDSSPLAG